MAIAFVQSALRDIALAQMSDAVVINGVSSGNLVVLGIVTEAPGTSVTSVTDSEGNTYTRRAGRQFQSGGGGSEIWSAHNVTGGDLTITANFSASVASALHALEYFGIDATDPFDKAASAGGSGTALSSGNTTTTAQADELLVGFGSYHAGGGSATAGSSYTIREVATGFESFSEDRIVSATGTYAADGSIANTGAWTMCIATFKAASSGRTTKNTRAFPLGVEVGMNWRGAA